MPVPMYGASARTSGTACFCMLAPIRARLASSCSRNGISAVPTETICFGRHVHVVDLGRRHVADVGGGAEEALRLEHLAQVVEAGRLRRAAHEHAVVAGTCRRR